MPDNRHYDDHKPGANQSGLPKLNPAPLNEDVGHGSLDLEASRYGISGLRPDGVSTETHKTSGQSAGAGEAALQGNVGDRANGARELSAQDRPLVRQTTGSETAPDSNVPPSSDIRKSPAQTGAVPPPLVPGDPLSAPRPGLRMPQAQSDGMKPPTKPPAEVALVSPREEPAKPKPPVNNGGGGNPPFDLEDFIREAEEGARGAKVQSEVKRLGSEICELHSRGVPVIRIHKGLKKRGLISCSHTRFGEVCRDLFPNVFDKERRRPA